MKASERYAKLVVHRHIPTPLSDELDKLQEIADDFEEQNSEGIKAEAQEARTDWNAAKWALDHNLDPWNPLS